MEFLKKIIHHKRSELIARKMLRPENDLTRSIFYNRQPVSLFDKLAAVSGPSVIAEFKRRSPSKGFLNQYANVSEVVPGYQEAGAAAISVLTDEYFFEGSLTDLSEARSMVRLPILRKDFILDPYQITEAKSYGADVVLLIGAILEKNQLLDLHRRAIDLGLEVLVEIHREDELEKLPGSIRLLGINNRDLDTLEVDVKTSLDLVPKLPGETIWISESGIADTGTVMELWNNGFKGFLIGENFMKQIAPARACAEFMNRLNMFQ